MKTASGQATVEMALVLPVLVLFIGGAVGLVYLGQQSLKVQEAANVAARIQGQERVAGGRDLTSIERDNFGGMGEGDDETDDPNVTTSRDGDPSVFGRWYTLVRRMFGRRTEGLVIRKPEIGQNVDKVRIVRMIELPKVPFMDGQRRKIKLVGEAYGGEDTHMYGLPRWGKTGSSNDPEWQNIIKENYK